MDALTARRLAERELAGLHDRSGGPLIDHVARVASAVPPEARAVAWLHEVIEHAGATEDTLRRAGLDDEAITAVRLLTRAAEEPYDTHALGLAFAPGRSGRLARMVKVADLDDHLAHIPPTVDAPPYAWARRHIAWADAPVPVRRAGPLAA